MKKPSIRVACHSPSCEALGLGDMGAILSRASDLRFKTLTGSDFSYFSVFNEQQ